MVVDDSTCRAGAPLRPDQTDPPLVVDPDAPLSPAAAVQGVEPLPGRRQVAPAGRRVVRPWREGVGRQSRGLSSRRRVARPIRGGRGDTSDTDLVTRSGWWSRRGRNPFSPSAPALGRSPPGCGGRQLRTARPARAPPRRAVPELRRSRQATMPVVVFIGNVRVFVRVGFWNRAILAPAGPAIIGRLAAVHAWGPAVCAACKADQELQTVTAGAHVMRDPILRIRT